MDWAALGDIFEHHKVIDLSHELTFVVIIHFIPFCWKLTQRIFFYHFGAIKMKVAMKPLSLAVLAGLSLTLAGCTTTPDTDEVIKLHCRRDNGHHTNLMDYDYYKDKPSQKIGLARTATLVKEAQNASNKNDVLVDNGDLHPRCPIGDYMADKGIVAGGPPCPKAMNQLAMMRSEHR